MDSENEKVFTGQLDENGKAVQRKQDEFYDEFKKNIRKLVDQEKELIYPICRNYSYLLNYPDDIQPDWLDGIKEMYEYIFGNYDGNEYISTYNAKEGKGKCYIFGDVSLEELKSIYKEKFES